MDPHKRTRKNDPIDAAQNASPHHTNKKKIQKETRSKKDEDKAKEGNENLERWKMGRRERGEDGEENQGGSGDETEDGHSSNTNCDQDSDISFMNDTDEEIDTAVIEEEDRIEYMKRSTDEAMERMKTTKIQCWIKTHRRMKWRLATRIASLPKERWMVKAAVWNPELSTTEQWGDQEKDGKTRLMNSSSLEKLNRRQKVI